jgi:hypothetical protein
MVEGPYRLHRVKRGLFFLGKKTYQYEREYILFNANYKVRIYWEVKGANPDIYRLVETLETFPDIRYLWSLAKDVEEELGSPKVVSVHTL